MVRPIGDGDEQVGDAEQDEQRRRRHAGRLQDRDDDRAATAMNGGVEHVDGRDHAGAAVGAGPGLHRGEGRHDEQAAGDGEAGEIDRDVDAAAGARRSPVAVEVRRSASRRQVDQPRSMANRRRAARAPSSVGSRMMRPAASQAASPEPTAIAIEKIAR